MEDLTTMNENNKRRVQKARKANVPEPYLITSKESLKTMPPFPFPDMNGDPFGWELEEELEIYTPVFRAQHRPEIGVGQFLYKIKNEFLGMGFGILDYDDNVVTIGIYSKEEK